jgi:hypothetical protein
MPTEPNCRFILPQVGRDWTPAFMQRSHMMIKSRFLRRFPADRCQSGSARKISPMPQLDLGVWPPAKDRQLAPEHEESQARSTAHLGRGARPARASGKKTEVDARTINGDLRKAGIADASGASAGRAPHAIEFCTRRCTNSIAAWETSQFAAESRLRTPHALFAETPPDQLIELAAYATPSTQAVRLVKRARLRASLRSSGVNRGLAGATACGTEPGAASA